MIQDNIVPYVKFKHSEVQYSAFRLSQSIGSCVRFNGPHNTGESRQFVHTTLEKLSHFTKGMCEPSHFTKGMCGPSHFTKGKCRPQINLMILIV